MFVVSSHCFVFIDRLLVLFFSATRYTRRRQKRLFMLAVLVTMIIYTLYLVDNILRLDNLSQQTCKYQRARTLNYDKNQQYLEEFKF